MITSVAALHHMDARAALGRMSQLLAPGGRLAIVGLARSRLPADLPWEAAAVIAHRGYHLTRTYREQSAPVVWPLPHTYTQMHALALADAASRPVPSPPAVALLPDLDQAVTSKQQFEQQTPLYDLGRHHTSRSASSQLAPELGRIRTVSTATGSGS
jgi:hypothetical protein